MSIGPARAHLALDRADGPVGVGDRLALRDLADEHLAGLGEADDRRRRPAALGVRDDGGLARLRGRDDRVGRAEVDTDGLGHEVPPLSLLLVVELLRSRQAPGCAPCHRPPGVASCSITNLSALLSRSVLAQQTSSSERVSGLKEAERRGRTAPRAERECRGVGADGSDRRERGRLRTSAPGVPASRPG